jgi:hypothetical protein
MKQNFDNTERPGKTFRKKFIKALNKVLFGIGSMSSLIINLKILMDSFDILDKNGDKTIDWSWWVGTNPWWQSIAGIVFSCTNLLFWYIGIDVIGKHLFENWGKHKHLGV